MSLRCPKCCLMAKRFNKGEAFVFTSMVFQLRQSISAMWTLILLRSLYLAVALAQTTPPEYCPRICDCSGSIAKCIERDLKGIPDGVSKDVTILDLSGNYISSIQNDTFLQFTKLIELNLNYNDIEAVSKLGKFPKSLRHLHLKGNKINILPGKWDQFTKLDISDNRITRIGNGTFGRSTVLNELNLSNNQITTVAFHALRNLPNLQTLRLDGNNLTNVPNLSLKSLVTLDLSRNQLDSIPVVLGKHTLFTMTPLLETLKLSNNKFKSLLTATFYELKLKTLYLDNNLLTQINGGLLFGLGELEHLHLQNNQIANITSHSWNNFCCKKLKYLNLANNKLKRIVLDVTRKHSYGGTFSHLDSLEFLNLSSNGIFGIVDNSFKNLQKLQVLDLSKNKLSWSSYDSNGTFRGLQRLRHLNLNKNEITSVVKVMFDEVPSVEKLDMRNNPIEEINRDAFRPLTSLRDLRMNSRSLYCSCKLRWFSQWLATKKFSRSVVLKCRQPNKLSGKRLSKIAPKDLLCDSARPEITEHPESLTVLEGDDVQLSCTVKNGSMKGIKIVWKKDMKNVRIDSNRTKVKEYTQVTDNKFKFYKSVLLLRDVNEAQDGGLYQCVVVTRVGELKSRKARLQVFVPPRFTSKPAENLITTLGGDVRFNCSASGYPSPAISFNKVQRSKLFSLKGRLDLSESETFLIRNLTMDDVGLYRCFAKSDAGLVNTSFHINIFSKPFPMHPMLDKVALLHDSVMFVCAMKGWPTPHYNWFKDDKPMNTTASNVQLRRELNAEYLVILHAEYSDAGVYKCRVNNSLGTTELVSRLDVVKDLSRKDSPIERVTRNTLIGAVVFATAVTMVITILVCIAVLHAVSRRGRGLCTNRRKDTGVVVLGSFETVAESDKQEYIQMSENSPSESPRSSSTFVTSESHTPSDSHFLQTSSSDSGSTKENREGSYDGRQSSGVCSMNSSTSSLASTSTKQRNTNHTNTNHRNTFPFSNTSTASYPYPTTTYVYDASDDNTSCASRNHRPARQTLLLTYNEQHFPVKRKHKSPRSRDRHHVNKRRNGQEQEKIYNEVTDDKLVGVNTELDVTAI